MPPGASHAHQRPPRLTQTTAQKANLEPWFGPHLQRNVYLSLLHMEADDGQEKAPKVPESILRAALIRRAVEDIHRIIQIRNAKQACSNLLAKGSVGDDLWQRFTRAESEMEAELRDVVMEVCWAVSNVWSIFGNSNKNAARPTDSHPTGDRASSNPPTRSPPTPCSMPRSTRSSPRPRLRSSGGRSAARPSLQTL